MVRTWLGSKRPPIKADAVEQGANRQLAVNLVAVTGLRQHVFPEEVEGGPGVGMLCLGPLLGRFSACGRN
jgi:hypothetical protein